MKYFSNKKWNRREIILFLERLEMYISSGLILNKALNVIENSLSKNKKTTFSLVCNFVEQGGYFSAALNKYINLPIIVTSIIHHGELSGQFSKSLSISKSLLEMEDDLIKKIISATTYPIIIAIFAILLTIALLRGVMPQIIPMLKSLNVELPIITKMMIFLSDTLRFYGLYIFVVLILVFIFTNFIYKKYSKPKEIFQVILMKVPIIGKIIFNYHLSIFLRSLGSLVETDFSIARSYSRVTESVSFLPLKLIFNNQILNIEGGKSFGKILEHKHIPQYVASLVTAGESSGFMAASLVRSANILDRDIEHSLKRVTSLIEPLMMIFMGLIVGAIALSIMMPIYDISKTLQR